MMNVIPRHSIHVIRRTFEELSHSASIDPTTMALLVKPCTKSPLSDTAIEVSTVYFRAGYTPKDFTIPAHWTTRILLERSRAIKCPSLPLQLAGGKKVQQVLAKPGVLERFLCDGKRWGEAFTFHTREVEEMREGWMEMWGLDEGESKEEGMHKARSRAAHLVLKPQREGGGNNVYTKAVLPFLDALPPKERQAWIAMELITPPKGTISYLLRAGGDGPVKAEVVSELGIFGWSLFGGGDGKIKEKEAGWLLRTKGKDNNEGGVAAGFSVLDSLVLV
jgi:glutathione synthase